MESRNSGAQEAQIGTLSIDNETDDDDSLQPNYADWVKGFVFGWGKRSLSSAASPTVTTTFSLRRTLSYYSLVMAFKDLGNLHLISYDDGLIEDGEFIVFMTTIIRFRRLYIFLFVTQLLFLF